MPAPNSRWSQVSGVFQALASCYAAEGKTVFPGFDETPSSALDEECDRWCRENYSRLAEAPVPPDLIRPWIMVRATLVASLAKCLDQDGEPSPGPLTRELFEQLMIHEWHGAMRDRWTLLMPLPDV